MLPFATLLLVSVILAETTMPTPTGTAVVSNLLPPYAAGPAFYHASIVRTSGNDIVYAITCSDSQQGRDACLTASLGTESQTFTQGPGGWTVNRFEASTTFGFGEFYTLCAFSGSTNGASQTASPYTMSCSARDLLTSTGSDTTKLLVETRSSSGTKGIFGLQQQAVTITAGFEKAPDATWLQPTATGGKSP